MLIDYEGHSNLDIAEESDTGELDESNEMQDNDQGIANSSPQQPGHDSSPKPSTGSRDSSPASSIKGKHHESSSTKKRRKKPRNIYVTPQKLRLLRQKQKEREEHKKKVGLADAMTGDGIHYGSSQDSVNNAFEEDFGPLLRGEAVVIEDTQSSANSLDVAVDLLLETALGEIGLSDIKKEEGDGVIINDVGIDAYREEDDTKDIIYVERNLSPPISSPSKELSLDAPAGSQEITGGGSPSYQLLAEAEKGFEKHEQANDEETAVSESSPEAQKIMPLMKESVIHVPIRKLTQTGDEEVPHSRRSVSILSTVSHESQFQAELSVARPLGLEILDDPETYLSRPIERRLSFGPDHELQERIAKGATTVTDLEEGGDVIMVNFSISSSDI